MTFIEKFDYLKKKYASKADTAKLTDTFIAAQITMSDEDCGGTFYAAFIDGKLSFEPYDYHDNTVAVIVNSALLEECIKGKADPVKEYLEGRLQAWGNLDHALQLIECLKGKKKATKNEAEETAESKPAKKACKKRTTAKKSETAVETAAVEAPTVTETAEETPKKKTATKKTGTKKTSTKKTTKE